MDEKKCRRIYKEEIEEYGKCGYCSKKFDCMHKALETGLNFPWLDDMK